MQATLREERGSQARRHNHALVALARQVWSDDCPLDTALGTICETAAEVLDVERVNIWRLQPGRRRLRCVHAYERATGRHNAPGYDDAFDADSEYGRLLGEVRVLRAAEVARDATLSASWATLGEYLRWQGVLSLLVALVRSAGVLLGVVFHGRVVRARLWIGVDEAFAAGSGDYVALAIEVARRREAERRLRHL